MITNVETVVNPLDTQVDLTTRESSIVEENRTLRHVMVQLWQAWANGQELPTSIPGFSEITSSRSSSSQVPISDHFFPPWYGFQANEICEYHSGGPGHNTDNCWTLKSVIKKLIDHGVVVVTDDQNTPNVTNNPLSAQNNLVGMICDDQEYKLIGKIGKLFRKI
ncbi:hypothetical protein H5410_027965 [Solanum commersonii]|uniref:Uncharacterized protein n=1 Tax=Solanum commersonii TaxID=4109 RepID=A0A9J5Z0N9_SOLCO|nr:hypothetical protein H5410_027965 [Solanum commersonii]